MYYKVSHQSSYEYSEPVSLCQNLAHLTPRDTAEQRCLKTRLLIHPDPAVVSSRVDYFGNLATFFTVQEPHQQLLVQVDHLVEVTPRPALEPAETPPWEEVRDGIAADRSAAGRDAFQFVFGSRFAEPSAELTRYAAASFPAGRPLLEAVIDLTRRIHRDFLYDPRATTVSTPLHEVFAHRRGVCQDFAHLEIACLRGLGLPARYISGYLATTPASGQPRLVGADASHAWVSVYVPTAGWIDVDPTNNQVPCERHVLLAWGRDFDDVSPIKGVILGGGEHQINVAVDVEPCTGEAPPGYRPE